MGAGRILAATLAAVLALSSCAGLPEPAATASPSAPTAILLPGALDFPPLNGSKILSPCDGWFTRTPIAPPRGACVELDPSITDTRLIQSAYRVSILLEGWRFDLGAGNTFTYSRENSATGCRDTLAFSGFTKRLNAERTDFDLTSGVIYTFQLGEPVCPSPATRQGNAP